MRKIDKHKTAFQMAAKTINFEKVVLDRLEALAKKAGTTVSKLVNRLCRDKVLTDINYYRDLKKHHYLEMQRADYMIQECEAKIEVG